MKPEEILADVLPLVAATEPKNTYVPKRGPEDAKTKARRKAEKRSRKINRKGGWK
jgi:hypothetical protein